MTTPKPAKRVVAQTYPKWVKLGDLPLIVQSVAEEAAVKNGTAKVETTHSAQGDSHKVVL